MSIQTILRTKLETVFNEKQASVLAEVIEDAYSDLVRTGDFNELKAIVKDLAINVGELTEAQKGSEQRLTKIEGIVAELTEAQKKTEEELRDLVKEHKKTRQEVGGLSTAFGYVLENEAYKGLPELLERDYELVVKGRLKRQFVKDKKGNYIELNIFGEASQAGKSITIVGEGKSQLSKNKVNEFIRKKLKHIEGVYTALFPLLITHMISEPDVEEYAKNKGIALYYSYDL